MLNGYEVLTDAKRVHVEFEMPEIKRLEGFLSGYRENPDAIWPARVMDAIPLSLDDQDVVNAARMNLAYEICELEKGSFGKKVIEKLKTRFRDYKKVSLSGYQLQHGQPVWHFNLEEGLAYLEHDKSRKGISPSSFKQSALRLVQTVLCKKAVQLVRELGSKEGGNFLTDLPTHTKDRVEYMHSKGYLGEGVEHRVSMELIDHYLYFMHLYHKSEYASKVENQISTPFNAIDVKSRMEGLVAISMELCSDNVRKPRKWQFGTGNP